MFCYGLNVYVPASPYTHTNSYVEEETPSRRGPDPIRVVSLVSREEMPESSLSPPLFLAQRRGQGRAQWEKSGHLQARRRGLTRNCASTPWSWDFQPPELWEKNFSLVKSPSRWYLLRSPEQTKTRTIGNFLVVTNSTTFCKMLTSEGGEWGCSLCATFL